MSRISTAFLTCPPLLSPLLVILIAMPTNADLVGTSIDGLGGKVDVIEVDHYDSVSYSVDILDGSSTVSAFAVSNGGGIILGFSAGDDESELAAGISFGPSPYTDRSGWNAVALDSGAWDSGFQILGASSGVSFNTQTIGNYSALFGSDPLVSLYYHDSSGGSAIDESSDEIEEFHLDLGIPFSEFVALDSSGAIIDGSMVTAVPEPSAFLFLGLASVGVFVVRKVRVGRRDQQLAA